MYLSACPSIGPSILHLTHAYLPIEAPINSSTHLSIHCHPFLICSASYSFIHLCLSIHFSVSIRLSIHMLLHVTGCLSIYPSIHPFTHSSLFCLSIHLFIILNKLIICQASFISIYPSACLSICYRLVHLAYCQFVHLSVLHHSFVASVYVHTPIIPFSCFCQHPSVCPSTCPSTNSAIYQSTRPLICPSVSIHLSM